MDKVILYSKERGTWNLFVYGEWYLEGTYEECEKALANINCCENEVCEED